MIDEDGYDDAIDSPTYQPRRLRCPVCLLGLGLVSLAVMMALAEWVWVKL